MASFARARRSSIGVIIFVCSLLAVPRVLLVADWLVGQMFELPPSLDFQ